MKVHIGPYPNWWGPYQIADLLQHFGVSEDRCHEIGERLAKTPLAKICEWIHSKQKRKVVVKLDNYDSWSADHTLSIIILPLLEQLKKDKHGSPFVDLADVPEHLHPPKDEVVDQNNGETDSLFHDRWAWVLDEMIWAHHAIVHDTSGQFFGHDEDDDFSDFQKSMSTMKYDREGHLAHEARIRNGLALFGKYYQALWD